MYEQDILCGITKDTFEIPHTVFNPNIQNMDGLM